ncbi:DNA cytosine methyltransferase [Xylanimonas allomyrinae]|uniref:DNA cytosine methyltransferase n=1 Tax=Xylanimonas allomyrinae TaxID=2509459 RepID=UPI001B874841|nr:DNA cytosine methyltransferase [Xylanimonas allomyrinae]
MTGIPMIDLFAGCGGMTQGFVEEGFEPILAVEWDKAAAATYAANFGHKHVIAGDIAEVPTEDIPRARVIIGGPPCQGFSNLGLKDINDPRNQLWREYLRFVGAAKPEIFVIENVDRFSKSPEFQMLLAEQDHGALKDYELTHAVLNAADYGVAQRRKRTIVIGSRVGKIEMPEPTHDRNGGEGTRLKPWVTLRDVIGHLAEQAPDSTELPSGTSYAFEFDGMTMPGSYRGLELHIKRNPRKESLERYAFVPPGGGGSTCRSTCYPTAGRTSRRARPTSWAAGAGTLPPSRSGRSSTSRRRASTFTPSGSRPPFRTTGTKARSEATMSFRSTVC